MPEHTYIEIPPPDELTARILALADDENRTVEEVVAEAFARYERKTRHIRT